MNRKEHERKCKICESVMYYLGHKEPWNVDSYICKTCGTLLAENEYKDNWEDRDGNDLDDESVWNPWVEKLATISRVETKFNNVKFKMTITQLLQVKSLLDSI